MKKGFAFSYVHGKAKATPSFTRLTDNLTKLDELYKKELSTKSEKFKLYTVNRIAKNYVSLAERIKNMRLSLTAETKDEKKNLEIDVILGYYYLVEIALLENAATTFLVNVEKMIQKKLYGFDLADSTYLNFSKYSYLAAEKIIASGDIVMRTPLPHEIKGTDDEEYFLEELEAFKFTLREYSLSGFRNSIKISYSNGIDNVWTDKIKDRIREIDPPCNTCHNIAPDGFKGGRVDQEYIDAMERIHMLTIVEEGNFKHHKYTVTQVDSLFAEMRIIAERRLVEEGIYVSKLTKILDSVRVENRSLENELIKQYGKTQIYSFRRDTPNNSKEIVIKRAFEEIEEKAETLKRVLLLSFYNDVQ